MLYVELQHHKVIPYLPSLLVSGPKPSACDSPQSMWWRYPELSKPHVQIEKCDIQLIDLIQSEICF